MMTARGRLRHAAALATATLVLLSAPACRSLRLDGPLTTGDSDWRMEGGSGGRDNRAQEAAFAPPLEREWVRKTSAAFGPGSALGIGGVLFVGTLKGELVALRADSGKPLGSRRFGNALVGAPVADHRTVYLANSWGRTVLAAHDFTTGDSRWELKGVPIEAGMLLADSLLIVADIEGTVSAYGIEDGSLKWQNPTDPHLGIFASPAAGDDVVIAADDQGTVRAFDLLTGTERWSRNVGAPVLEGLAVSGRSVLVPTVRGAMLCLDVRSGQLRWKYSAENPLVRMSPAAVEAGIAVFGGTDGIMRAVELETGRVSWQFRGDGNFVSAPLLNAGFVYAGSLDRNLYALRMTDGTKVWSERLEGPVRSALALHEGRLIVLAEPRHVYSFTPASYARMEDPR